MPPEGEDSSLLETVAPTEAVTPEAEAAADGDARDGVGASLKLGASVKLAPLTLTLAVELLEGAAEGLSVQLGETLQSAVSDKAAEGDAAPAGDCEARSDADTAGDRLSLGEPEEEPVKSGERLALRAGVTVRVPVCFVEVVPDTLGQRLTPSVRLSSAEADTLRDDASFMVRVSVVRGEGDTLDEPLSEGVRAARRMVELTVPERV